MKASITPSLYKRLVAAIGEGDSSQSNFIQEAIKDRLAALESGATPPPEAQVGAGTAAPSDNRWTPEKAEFLSSLIASTFRKVESGEN